MTQITGGYYCKKLQHWVKVLKPTRDKYRPCIHSKCYHRMRGSERRKNFEPVTMEDVLNQQIRGFLIRKEESLEKTKERS